MRHHRIHRRRILARIWLLLQSRQLALVLLVVVALAVAVASVVPQQGRVDLEAHAAWKSANPLLSRVLEVSLLDRIYSSWWFFTAVALLLTNTFVCTLTRIPSLLRQEARWPRLNEEQISRRLENWTTLEATLSAPEVTAAVQGRLLRQGYRVKREDADGKSFVSARKGELAQWGSLLFHFSFLVVLAGIVFVQLTRYVGTIVITEGQTLTERREDYLRVGRIPLLGMKHQGFQVRLERFVPTYYQGIVGTDYAADLTILEEGNVMKRQRVKVNQPISYKGVSFLLERYGFAPLLALESAEERILFDGYVNLALIPPGKMDLFAIPETSLTVRASLFPDLVMVDGAPDSRSLEPQNPVLYLEVVEEGRVVFQGPLPLGESVALGERSLAFDDLRYWTQYQAIRDPGKGVIFAGLWLGLAGLVVRYLSTAKQVWAVVQELPGGARLTLGGSAHQVDALFGEEFASLARELGEEVSGDPR